jgi:hypothetical protein
MVIVSGFVPAVYIACQDLVKCCRGLSVWAKPEHFAAGTYQNITLLFRLIVFQESAKLWLMLIEIS